MKRGKSILMVTHDIHVALRANRILYLEDGKIIGELTLPLFCPDEEKVVRHKLVHGFIQWNGRRQKKWKC